MSISTAYMDFSFEANNKKRQYTLSLEVRLCDAIRDLFSSLLSAPKLVRQVEPGKFVEVERNSAPLAMQCWR